MLVAPEDEQPQPVAPSHATYETWVSALRDIDKNNAGKARRKCGEAIRSCIHAYEMYIRSMIHRYNTSESTVYVAGYRLGCILLRVPVYDYSLDYRRSGTIPHGWSNVLLPKLTMDMGLSFLLVSPEAKGTPVCQPMITKGGLVTVMFAYPKNAPADTSSDLGSLHLNLIMVPFIPHCIGRCGVKMAVARAAEDYAHVEREKRDGKLATATIAVRDHVVFFTINDLKWTQHKSSVENRKRLTHYNAWFEGDWIEEDDAESAWVTSQNIRYEHDGHEFGVNIDSLVLMKHTGKVVGSVSTCYQRRITDTFNVTHFPSAVVMYAERSTGQESAIRFDRNPKLFFSGSTTETFAPIPNNTGTTYLVLHAPYDIHFLQYKNTIKINVSYDSTDRFFLVSGVPGNELFHTSITLWKPCRQLRVVLWCHSTETVIPQSSPIAVLYSIRATEGDVYAHDESAAFKQLDQINVVGNYVGDMRLPKENFLIQESQTPPANNK